MLCVYAVDTVGNSPMKILTESYHQINFMQLQFLK